VGVLSVFFIVERNQERERQFERDPLRASSSSQRQVGSSKGRRGRNLLIAAAVGILAVGGTGLSMLRGGSSDFVSMAKSMLGSSTASRELRLGAADLDLAGTEYAKWLIANAEDEAEATVGISPSEPAGTVSGGPAPKDRQAKPAAKRKREYAGPVVEPERRKQVETAVQAMPAAERKQVLDGVVRFYRVSFLDIAEADGDVVSLRKNGATMGRVTLGYAFQTVSVPFAAGESAQISVLGDVDGGGGITVGLKSSLGEMAGGVIFPGQEVTWKVTLP
jgi:hypothetical protein